MSAIGFFDKYIELPHSPVPISVFLVVESALREAWNCLRESDKKTGILSEHEDCITHALYEVLSDTIFSKGIIIGFDAKTFETPSREPKVRDYKGESIDKMPDLLIRVRNRNIYKKSQDGVFIECKPVSKGHPITTHYCKKGIIRFLKGEYAWAMPQALIVGYITGDYTIEPKLLNAINKGKYNNIESAQTRCVNSNTTPFSEGSYITRHERNFCYVETKEKAPAITLRHLWLKCD